jgi:hypothetical protein
MAEIRIDADKAERIIAQIPLAGAQAAPGGDWAD